MSIVIFKSIGYYVEKAISGNFFMRILEIRHKNIALHKTCVGLKFIFFLLVVMPMQLTAQQKKERITYYQDIEPIILKNCVHCHRPAQSAPFSLLTYEDISKRGEFIAYVTRTRYMPPWKADLSFQSYLNERSLSDRAIAMIQRWVESGMPKGKKAGRRSTTSEIPVSEQPSLSVEMPSPYTISTKSIDDYRFFNIPTHLNKDQYITKIEFIAGNKKLLHHSRLMTDTTHKVRSIHGLSANDPKVSDFEKYPPLDKFLYGWVPGNFPIEFPKGTGKKLHKDTDIILNIHYAPNARENQIDQSRINFYFAKDKVDRKVFSLAIAEESISNPPLLIKANEKKTFYSSFGPIPIDISAVAVLPHMHYLGKTFRAFAVTPAGEAIHLSKINEWDFKWQDTYQFKKLLHIPAGSTILMEATFDNTIDNPANPSAPPVDVTYGWNTTSEMMDLVLYYLEYRTGDESISPYEE